MLINKVGDYRYALDENTNGRKVFLYGDALSMSNYSKLYKQIHRKLTGIENKEYVDTLLSAHDTIFMRKGYFHQLMHQPVVVYMLFYGYFIQPMQVVNTNRVCYG